MELNPQLPTQFCPFHPSPLWGPCTREDNGRCSPLADGTHDVVCPFSLVEPRVVAIPHQLTGLCLVSPHVLVEVPKVHVRELLQAQCSCTGQPPSVPTRPMRRGRGQAAPPVYPGLRHWGVMCTCPQTWTPGSYEPGFCHIRPYRKTQRNSFPHFKP